MILLDLIFRIPISDRVVGGVAVVRYGDNPLAAIERVKDKIREISPGLPSKTLTAPV